MRFSIIIATYNQRNLLLQTIKSVVRQSYPAHEIIVVDDGSKDGTAEEVASRYPSVKLIVQSNLGKCIARNTGILAASGEWIALLDHDDLWHPEKLATVAEASRRLPEIAAFTHGVWYFAATEDGPEGGFGFRRNFVAADLD